MNLGQLRAAIKVIGRASVLSATLPGPALAHASEQGFVLLLPTDIYIAAGTASVALTVVVLAALPGQVVRRAFSTLRLWRPHWAGARLVASCLSALYLWALVWIGLEGPRDPLANPMSLFIWTIWWMGLVTLQGLLGNLWRWIDPWTGPVFLARRLVGLRPVLRLPDRLGHAPAVFLLLCFGAFLLADPAPADPARLARAVGGYWAVTVLAMLLFGPRWRLRAEWVSVLMRSYARLGVFGRRGGRLGVGLPGWQILNGAAPPVSLAVFTLMILGTGSFDGLNETFWWLDLLGINPLEFPGRSAVMAQNLAGLLIANLALVTVFGAAVWAGTRLVANRPSARAAFAILAPSILPIALGYHIAHYLPSFLVDSQYALAAASDPLARGDDLLGLGTYYVTTGFFNTQASVRLIWLSQAGAVVLGHILAILLAHILALRAFGSTRQAVLSQIPLAVFMILYTFFGLWLLASPRGA